MREDSKADDRRPHPKAQLVVGPMFPRFGEQEVSDDYVRLVIEASGHGSSEGYLQAWRWIVVRSHVGRKYLEASTSIKVPLSSAPVILICLADTLAWKSTPQRLQEMVASRKITEEEGQEALRRVREYYSSSPEVARRTALANAFVAVHQTLLGAAECGLSAYWVTEFDEARVKTHFHIPDHFLVAALLPMGHTEAAPDPPLPDLPVHSFVYREKFGEAFDSHHSESPVA
ncbi:MAG TPA: nitroreductase family protein [Terriglobia bacterium]|nr:nitroreductase family protein [Terriglobia bacterium]